MKVNVTRIQATAEAEKLAAAGFKQTEIAKKLYDLGYPSPKTGAPLTPSSVCQMLKSGKKRRRRTTAKAAPPPAKKKRGSIEAIKSILKLRGMDAEERIALALLVID